MGKMNPGMKMMLLSKATERRPRSEYSGNGNDRRMIGYERPENNDRGGGSEMRRYAGYEGSPRSEHNEYRPEDMRYPAGGWHDPPMDRYPVGSHYPEREYMPERFPPWTDREASESRRRRDRKGRFMMAGMDDDDDEDYRPKSHYGNDYGDIYARGMIYAPGAMNRPTNDQRHEYAPVTEGKARMWVKSMSAGEKFPVDHTEPHRTALCPDCEKWGFYVAMNAMYSDHCETAKKIGMDKPDFYAMLAKDFLMDDDAGPHKLQKYMEYIPEK